jgi:uncharacterized protein DUF4388
MELTGDLSDFALTDILQILALSRKTGTLSLESEGVSGKITIEGGRITHAARWPGEALSDWLVRERCLNANDLAKLKQIGEQDSRLWTLDSLILESGLMALDRLECFTKQHIQEVVGHLLRLEKGRFGIDLNQPKLVEALSEVKLRNGVEVGEILLGIAKDIDEDSRDEGPTEAEEWQLETLEEAEILPEPARSQNGNGHHKRELQALDQNDRISLLCSMLAEMRSHSFEAEVSLLIMRYASEVATRGVLFVVKDDTIAGLGQFGVHSSGGQSADEKVREIQIPVGADTFFGQVARAGEPYIGKMPEGYWYSELLGQIGGNGAPISVFALPLMCNGRAVFIFYGDNFPGASNMVGLDELVVLVNQASVVMEKIVLERMFHELSRRKDRA